MKKRFDEFDVEKLIPKKKELTIFSTIAGDRTLTPAKKREIKEKQGFKCAECKRKFLEWQLHVHHKKDVSKHKSPYGADLPFYSLGKKIKPKYDRMNNLVALCIPCHNKTKKKNKKKSFYDEIMKM